MTTETISFVIKRTRAETIRELDAKYNREVEERVNKVHNETLEKVAQMVEKRKGIPEHHSNIARLIRGMKNEPIKTENGDMRDDHSQKREEG